MPHLCGFGADRLGPFGPAATGQPCSPRLRQWSEVRFQQDPVRLSATRQPLRGRRHGRLGGSASSPSFGGFDRSRFRVRRLSRWFPGLGVAASVARRKSVDQTVIYINTDVGVVKLLSELGFLGSGRFLGFCCCAVGGLRWGAFCPLCPSDISPTSGGTLPPRLASPWPSPAVVGCFGGEGMCP